MALTHPLQRFIQGFVLGEGEGVEWEEGRRGQQQFISPKYSG